MRWLAGPWINFYRKNTCWTLGLTLLCGALAFTGASPLAPARDPMSFDDLDTLLDLDPYLPIPPIRRLFPPDVVPVWKAALRAPDVDLRRRAAETIAQAASLGMPGLEPTVPDLLQLAASQQEPILVRIAAGRALAELDIRSASETLTQVLREAGMDRASFLIEPLAQWGSHTAGRWWIELASQPKSVEYQKVLAIQGLGRLRWKEALPMLQEQLIDRQQPAAVRLAAARALGRIDPAEATQLASRWTGDSATARLERLRAAELLQEASGSEALAQLERLATDDDPVIANRALDRLYELDLEKVAQLAPRLLDAADSSVRRWAVRAIGHFPATEHVELLARHLADPHPELRARTRDILLAFAEQPPLRESVLAVAQQALDQEDWRPIEQAARIVGKLRHRPSAARLAALIEMPRLEASVSAAWALRRLEVPEVLPEVLERATRLSEAGMQRANTVDLDPLLSQVFQIFGVMQYRPAEPLLKRFLPKNSMSPEARAAAIWALGRFYANDPNPNLVATLVERLADVNSQPPDHDRVRQMCAVSLGRMRAESALPTLRQFYEREGSNMPTGLACGWAIEQITGERYQPPSQLALYLQGWFLVPWK